MRGIVLACLAGLLMLMTSATGRAQGAEETLKATVVEGKGGEAAKEAPAGTAGTTCSQGKNKRTVTVSSRDAAKGVPCEVHYRKETEQPGHDEVIYTADNELSYCVAKAQSFVEKLRGWGWTCE